MIFSNKNDAPSVEKKVNTLAPAFSYPRVKRQGKSIYTEDASFYENTLDTDLEDDFTEVEPPLDLRVEAPPLNLSTENSELFIKPKVQHSPIFVLEDELDESPDPIQPLFLQDANPTFEQASSFLDASAIETKTDFSATTQEADPYSLDEAIAKLVGFEKNVSPEVPDEMPPTVLSEMPSQFSSEPLSQSGNEAPFSVPNTFIEREVEPGAKTVLTQDVEGTFAQMGFDNEPLTTPHVTKPAPEKRSPKEERSFQDRTLAFEDDEHYYNPLAIGEVLPSYNLAQTPVETTTLDVFEDLYEADIDLQESFAVAQKSTEALETLFSPSLVTPAVVETPALVSNAIETAPLVEQATGVEAFELEEVDPQESRWTLLEEEIPFAYSSAEEPPSFNEPAPYEHSTVALNHELDASLNASLEDVFLVDDQAEEFSETFDLPSLTVPSEAPSNENPFDFSLFLQDNPEADSPIVFQQSTDEERAIMASQPFLASEEADSSTEMFEAVQPLDFSIQNQWTVEDEDDLHLNVEPFVSFQEEPNVLLEEERVANSSENQAEPVTADFEVVSNKDPEQDAPADSLPNDLAIGRISEDDGYEHSTVALNHELDASLNASLEDVFLVDDQAEEFSETFDLPSLTVPSEAPSNENPFDFSLFLQDNPEADSPIVFQQSTDEERAIMASQPFLASEEADSSTEMFEAVQPLDFSIQNQWTVEDEDDLHLNVEPFVSFQEEPNVLLEEERVANSSENQAEPVTADFEVVSNKDPEQDAPADSLPNDLAIGRISEDDGNEENDLLERLLREAHSEETSVLDLSFQDLRQLEEGEDPISSPDASSYSYFSVESDNVEEESTAFLDTGVFITLEGLENDTAHESISMNLTPIPATPKSDSTPQLVHSMNAEDSDELDAFLEVPKASEATLGKYATLALEDLEVLVSQPFPCGESHLYLVHVNSVYAIIALKHHKYVLLQAFSSLPEGVELTGSTDAPQVQGDTLQLTWNASSFHEHIFDLQFGSWHALIVEDATRINVL
jgi:hypothetical protein